MESRRIIHSYYFIAGLYTLAASVIWGVNTLFLLDAGLDILGVFIANTFFSIGMAVFEIPTGVLADTRGRRYSFLLSALILSLGTLGYVGIASIGGSLVLFSIVSVFLGLGYTFYSGATEAWLVDALQATGFQGALDRVFARSAFISGGAMLLGTIGGGFLGDLDLAAPFLVRALLLLLLFVIAYFSMHDIGYQPRALTLERLPAEMKAVAQASLKFGWQRPSMRLIMLVNLLQTGFLYWGFYAWQPYFMELLGREVIWVAGVVAALVSLATMVGNSLVDWLTQYCGKRTTLMLWAAGIGAVATAGVGLVHSFWMAVFLLLVYMATTGIITPLLQAYVHQIVPSEQRAAIVSLNSMAGSGGGILGQSGLGYLSRAGTIAGGYLAGGLALFLTLPLLSLLRGLREPADLIFGKVGIRGSCAAQGIPPISGVDTQTSVSLATTD